MFSTFHRYVIWETLKVFCIALMVTMSLLTLAGGVKEAMRGGLPLILVARILPYVAIEMLRFTVPGCLLFAVASTVGRLSAANELTALKAAGISTLRGLFPLLVIAYLMSVFTYWLYDLSASWARQGLRQTLLASIDDIAYSTLTTEGSFRTKDIAIVVDGVTGRTLQKPRIDVFGQPDSPPSSLVADRAEIDINNGELLLRCYNARLELEGVGSFYFPTKLEHPVTLNGVTQPSEDTASPAEISSRVIQRQVAKEEAEVARLKTKLRELLEMELPAELVSTSQITSQTGAVTETAMQRVESPELQETRLALEHHQLRLNRLLGENQRRLANGFACLAFALIGIPVAAWRKTADSMSTFFVCFLPILLGYYPLLMVGETLVRSGYFQALSPWIADAIAATTGIGLIHRWLHR